MSNTISLFLAISQAALFVANMGLLATNLKLLRDCRKHNKEAESLNRETIAWAKSVHSEG